MIRDHFTGHRATAAWLAAAVTAAAALVLSGLDARAVGAPVPPRAGSAIVARSLMTTPTETATATAVVTATATMTATPGITGTVTATVRPPTATRTPTLPPKPSFLPVALRDAICIPVQGNLDVVFVVDGSSYMRKLRDGKPAWDAAKDIVGSMLGVMDFTPDGAGKQDQAGVVVFRHRTNIDEAVGLTGNPDEVRGFLHRLEYGSPSDTARMDIGLQVGAAMLDSSRRPDNTKLLVFVSELQAKNVPYRNVAGCEDKDENCTMLKRADEIKSAGTLIAVFATGQDNRGGELLGMANHTALGLVLPAQSAMRSVYELVVPRTPCPPWHFWPRRRQ